MVESAALRIGTWNLASGRLRDGRPASADQLAEAVRSLDVDVLAVQELDRHQPRSGGHDQLAVVADALGAADARFVPTLAGHPGPGRAWRAVPDDDVPDGPTYGIGLVSRLPVRAWRVHRFRGSRAVLPMSLPGPDGRARVVLIPDEPRVAVAAVVEGPGGPVTVVSTHLSFAPTVSVRQLRTLRRWVRSLPAPVVVAGDLNLPGPVPSWLTGWRPLARGRTYPAADPRLQLDHLLVAADGAGAPTRGTGDLGPRGPVSDHLPLVATLAASR